MYDQKRSVLSTGNFTVLLLESSWKICRTVPLEPSSGGRSVEKGCCQPVWVVIEPMAVVDGVVSRFLFDGGKIMKCVFRDKQMAWHSRKRWYNGKDTIQTPHFVDG